MSAPNLSERDLEMFAKIAVAPELLQLAGIGRVTDREARELYGIKGGGDMSGIAFPYWEPATMANGRRRWYVRIRRDHPEVDANGRPEKKYVAPYGDRKHIYFPPVPEWFADPSVPIIFVESEKASLALTAWCHRVGRNYLVLALGGVWAWRGKTDIKETASGERVPEHGPILDINIARDGRLTFVLFDANAATNPLVQAARREFEYYNR